MLEKKFSNRAKLVEKSKYVKTVINNKVKIAKLVVLIKELVLENKPYIKQVTDSMERATSGTKNIWIKLFSIGKFIVNYNWIYW